MTQGALFNFSFTEPEVNLVWTALNTCTVKGQDAPYLVGLMGKIQQKVVEAKSPAAPAENKPVAEKPVEEATVSA